MSPTFKAGHMKGKFHISEQRMWIWSVNKRLKHFGNSAAAVPYSKGHEQTRKKNCYRGIKT